MFAHAYAHAKPRSKAEKRKHENAPKKAPKVVSDDLLALARQADAINAMETPTRQPKDLGETLREPRPGFRLQPIFKTSKLCLPAYPRKTTARFPKTAYSIEDKPQPDLTRHFAVPDPQPKPQQRPKVKINDDKLVQIVAAADAARNDARVALNVELLIREMTCEVR